MTAISLMSKTFLKDRQFCKVASSHLFKDPTWLRTHHSDSVTLSSSLSSLLHAVVIVAAKQINRPVREIEENEHEREGNAREDIDPRAALGTAGEQFAR